MFISTRFIALWYQVQDQIQHFQQIISEWSMLLVIFNCLNLILSNVCSLFLICMLRLQNVRNEWFHLNVNVGHLSVLVSLFDFSVYFEGVSSFCFRGFYYFCCQGLSELTWRCVYTYCRHFGDLCKYLLFLYGLYDGAFFCVSQYLFLFYRQI